MKLITHIFDLDGTVLDSTHRATYGTDGKIDLQAWRTNNTPKQILADTITPLGQELQRALAFNPKLRSRSLFLTARDMTPADYQLLHKLGLSNIKVLSRAGFPDDIKAMPDHHFKAYALGLPLLFNQITLANGCQFYDDSLENCTILGQEFPQISPILVRNMADCIALK